MLDELDMIRTDFEDDTGGFGLVLAEFQRYLNTGCEQFEPTFGQHNRMAHKLLNKNKTTVGICGQAIGMHVKRCVPKYYENMHHNKMVRQSNWRRRRMLDEF